MTKKIYYEKRGRRYVPVAEYDNDYLESFPKGATLVICRPGSNSRRFNIDPNYAALIAAGTVAEDAISEVIRKATDLRPVRSPLTEGQRRAWKKLSEEFGDEIHMLQWPSAREACEEAVKAMTKEAEKLLENPSVKKAYDHFQLVCKLVNEQAEQGVK